MKKLWIFCGFVAYWVGWPYLYVSLRSSKRTRVVLRCGDEILVVRAWLGSGGWTLPGGGLHHGEDPKAGAMREVFEETGIRLEPDQLRQLFTKNVTNQHGLRYHCAAYGVDLVDKPELKKAALELVALEWRPLETLKHDTSLRHLLTPVLEAWDLKR